MYEDEIIAEVWRNRDAYAKKHHHNLAEMTADLQARQKSPHSELVDKRDQTKPSGRPPKDGYGIKKQKTANNPVHLTPSSGR